MSDGNYEVVEGSYPYLGLVVKPFAGAWEFGLQVEDARGRLSSLATCRLYHRHGARLAVELSWPQHASSADLDLHVVQSWADIQDIPGDCYFANGRDSGWDVGPEASEDDCYFSFDNRTREPPFGPGELMLFRNPREGAMDVVIDEFSSGAPDTDEEPVLVRIWLDNRLIYDTLEQRPSTEWWVARVDLKTNSAIRLDPPVESEE